MKNGKVSLGLIGAGRAGMIHARNFRAAVPNAALTAVADPCRENVQAALQELEIEKGYEDYRELLKDEEIDAVIIVTPTKYHCEIAVEAARAGKHILCEKPMAITVEECEIMEEAAARYHVKLQVAFMRRFDSAFMEARSVEEFPDFYDNVILSAGFENGMQGMIDGAQGVLYGYDARVEILGTRGCIFLGKTQERPITVCRSDMHRYESFTNSWKFLFKDAYLEEDMDFVDCILTDREPKVTGHDGKMAVKVVNAGNLSITSGKIITL